MIKISESVSVPKAEREIESPYLTREQAAKFLCVCPRTLDRWTKECGLPRLKMGLVVLYDKEALRQWVNVKMNENGGV